jgi:hypothetical protein
MPASKRKSGQPSGGAPPKKNKFAASAETNKTVAAKSKPAVKRQKKQPAAKKLAAKKSTAAPAATAAGSSSDRSNAALDAAFGRREYGLGSGIFALLLDDLVVESNMLEALPPDLLKLLARSIGATVGGSKSDLARKIRRQADGVPAGPPMPDDLEPLTVGELKALLQKRNLPLKGTMACHSQDSPHSVHMLSIDRSCLPLPDFLGCLTILAAQAGNKNCWLVLPPSRPSRRSGAPQPRLRWRRSGQRSNRSRSWSGPPVCIS